MKTLYYSHPDFLLHDTGPGHPESPERLKAIAKALSAPEFKGLIRVSPPMGTQQQVRLIHTQQYIDSLLRDLPLAGRHYVDSDTVLSSGSKNAAFRAVGAVCDAVDQVLAGRADNAFCAVRPPGHHAEPDRAMGFCLFNNVAIAAEHARLHHRLERIAIVDFDVHHGNGTQDVFYHQPQVLYASSHEMPGYPGTGHPSETGLGNIINVPLSAGNTGIDMMRKFKASILPELDHFRPEILLISAGFDAHRDDPLSGIDLLGSDYRWLTEELLAVAERHCKGRIISVLEGGYHLEALAASVAFHVKTLLGD
ncbi:MAG: histone deacetylase family protein [Gammaproteobacteria bacterium]